MISLHQVTKKFGQNTAVDNLSITIGSGEVVGLLGPNGAGKTTTMRLMTGYLAPDAGKIFINNIDITADSLSARRIIGYLPENNPLYEDMLVADYLNFSASLKGINGNRQAVINAAVKETGIKDVYYRPIGELSKGYRQRVGLAQAILHKPDILILDEPTEGLDPNQRVEIRELIKELGQKRTVIVSTHVLQEVQQTCDRVIIINKGRLLLDSSIKELLKKTLDIKIINIELTGKGVVKALKSLPGVLKVEKGSAAGQRQIYIISCESKTELRPTIFNLAKDNGWVLWELHQQETKLEEVFHTLTAASAG